MGNCLTTTNCACRRCGKSPTAWFTHNGWVSIRSTRLQTFLTLLTSTLCQVNDGNDGFLTKSLLTKRLRAQFVVVRQFSHWQALPFSSLAGLMDVCWYGSAVIVKWLSSDPFNLKFNLKFIISSPTSKYLHHVLSWRMCLQRAGFANVLCSFCYVVDVNECSSTTPVCPVGATCINTYGSFYCVTGVVGNLLGCKWPSVLITTYNNEMHNGRAGVLRRGSWVQTPFGGFFFVYIYNFIHHHMVAKKIS